MFTKLHLMYCICNHKERAFVCFATRSEESHSLSIWSAVLVMMMLMMIISIYMMYYLIHRAFYEPHMSRSKDKCDLNICIYSIDYIEAAEYL